MVFILSVYPYLHYIVQFIYKIMLRTKFPLKEVLGVNGVLGPRARVKSFNLEPLTRARADPGLSLRGPLSKEVVFKLYATF